MSGRSRRRGGRSPSAALAVVVVLVALAVGGGLASTAFDTASVPRGASADVTSDLDGAHALDVASAVHVNSTETLVTVTNHLTRDVTVTVALRDDSTALGDLVVDGATEGDSARFALAAGASETASLQVLDDGSLAGETVYFHVNATDAALDVSAVDRSVVIES